MKKLSFLALLLSGLAHASGFLGGGSGGGGGSSPSIGGVVTSGTQYSLLFIDPTATLAEDPTKLGYDVTNTRFCLGCDVTASTKTFKLTGTSQFTSLSTGLGHFDASGNLTSSLLVNADVSASAAIAYSKLSLTGGIVNADVSASAAIAYSKLALTNSVVTADLVDANVTNAKLANMAQSTIKGRAAGAGTGVPVDLTATQATAILNAFVGDSGAGGTKGLVPAPITGDATKVLYGDGTWQTPSSGFSDPMTTRGDIIIRNSSNTTARLGRGSNGTFLRSDGTDVSYANVTLTTDVTGVLPLANGGTNANLTASNGAIPYSSATAIALLAAGTSGQVLTSGGAGAPTWGYAGIPQIFGSRGTPRSVVAATGITSGASHMSTTAARQKIYVEGSVTGDSIAATITAGTIDGQEIVLQGRNNAKTVTLDSTTTNVVVNGTVTLGQDETLILTWDGTNWVELK